MLTDHGIKRFSAPPSVAAYHWDTSVKGLGVRVSPKGAKTFVVLIGSGRRLAIGRYPTLKLIEARAEAKRILAEKTLGSIRPVHTAFEDVVLDFLDATAKTSKPRTVADYKRLLRLHYPFGRRSVATITNRDITARLKGLPPSEKHHAYAAGRAFFNYCFRGGLIEKNPIEKVLVPVPSAPRERVLSPKELSQVFKTAWNGTTPFHAIVCLLLLTGQRRGEISALQRAWRKGESVTLPAELTKNGREHTFHLGPLAQAVLDRQPELKDNPFYFPASRDRWKTKPATTFNGWGKAKAAFDLEAGVKDWTLHDLRRTFATGLASLGVAIPVIEKLLNHVSGTFGGIVGVYQKYDYAPEMRDAIQKWEQSLSQIEGTGTVPLP